MYPRRLNSPIFNDSTLTIAAWLSVFKEIRKQLSQDDRTNFLHLFANAAAHLNNEQYKIWQEECHPVPLTSEKWFSEKMNYIHFNSVRKVFVEVAENWKYSSARNWLKNNDSIIRIDRNFSI